MIEAELDRTTVALLPQTRRKRRHGAPVYGDSAQRGAGAPLAGMRSRSRLLAHCYEVESRRTSRVRSPHMGPLFRRAVRPACGDAIRKRDAFAPGETRACTHLGGRICKGPCSAPRCAHFVMICNERDEARSRQLSCCREGIARQVACRDCRDSAATR
jgi:hypothetical protein